MEVNMNQYEKLYTEQKAAGLNSAIEAIKTISNLNWEDAYWISKILYVYGPGTVDDITVINILDSAFTKGLNYKSNSELYLDAAQMMARLYMKYKRYDEAINFLMSIDELSDSVLDWVHLYYAMAQVLSSNIVRISQKPRFFFERLDKVSDKSTVKRNEVFLNYVQRIKECLEDGTISDYAKDLIEAKSSEYNLTEKVNEIFTITKIETDGEGDVTEQEEESAPVIDETKINELKEIIDLKDNEINELKNKISELEQSISLLKTENEALKTETQNKDKALTQIRTSIQENKTEEPKPDITEFDNNGHALLNKYQTNQKILVIGAVAGNALDQLKLRAKHKGFEVEKDFEFITDYDKITNITGQLNYSRYAAIIAGPMGHSAAGNDGYSSFIEKIKGEGYPTLYEAKTESGKLKLNQSSFDRALMKFISYLLVL